MGDGERAHGAAFVFGDQHRQRLEFQFQQGDGHGVFEVDLGRLGVGQGAEGRAAMPRGAFNIQCARQFRDQMRLAAAGLACDNEKIEFRRLLEHVQQKAAQGLVTSRHERYFDACFPQPLLYDMGSLSAAETIQASFGIALDEIPPALDERGSRIAAHEFVAEPGCGLAAAAAIHGSHLGALRVRKQGYVCARGESPPGEFHR